MFKHLSLLFVLYSSLLCGYAFPDSDNNSDEIVIELMREDLSTLCSEQSFVFTYLGFTEEEMQIINNLKVNDSAVYDRFGELHLLAEDLPNFLREIGNDDEELIQVVTQIIERTAYRVNQAYNKETAWISVRAFVPNHRFDMPRWHIDGTYYKKTSDYQVKFAAVIKGNQTLFYDLPSEKREEFNANMFDREYLAEMLDPTDAFFGDIGYGAFFVVGNIAYGAVHSEPKIDSERLFFSILPGNKEEIEELYNKWYPTAK